MCSRLAVPQISSTGESIHEMNNPSSYNTDMCDLHLWEIAEAQILVKHN